MTASVPSHQRQFINDIEITTTQFTSLLTSNSLPAPTREQVWQASPTDNSSVDKGSNGFRFPVPGDPSNNGTPDIYFSATGGTSDFRLQFRKPG